MDRKSHRLESKEKGRERGQKHLQNASTTVCVCVCAYGGREGWKEMSPLASLISHLSARPTKLLSPPTSMSVSQSVGRSEEFLHPPSST